MNAPPQLIVFVFHYRVDETAKHVYDLYNSLRIPILPVVGGLQAGVTNEWITKNGKHFTAEGLPVPKTVVFSGKAEGGKIAELYDQYRGESLANLSSLVFKQDYKLATTTAVDRAIGIYKKKMEKLSTSSL